MYLSFSVPKIPSVWSLKCPLPPCSDANWHYHCSISFALVFWYLLVILCWTILVSGHKYIPVQCPEKSTVACFISVPYVSALLHYTAMKALVSTLIACLSLLRCSQLSPSSMLSLLLFPAAASPSSWPRASSLGHSCCFLYLLGLCTVGSESKSNSVLFLIHECGVTHVKCVDGILSFSGELCDVLHSCVTVMYYK